MRIVAIITSRWNSTRLPGKALADICGKPMLMRIVERVRQAKLVDEVVVATSTNSQPIIEFCKENTIKCYAGSEEDILDRLYQTAKKFKADIIVYIWGDAPLIYPIQIDNALKVFRAGYTDDYVTVISYGGVVAVTSFDWLKAVQNIVVAKNLRQDIHSLLCERILTVDTQEDLDRVREIYALL